MHKTALRPLTNSGLRKMREGGKQPRIGKSKGLRDYLRQKRYPSENGNSTLMKPAERSINEGRRNGRWKLGGLKGNIRANSQR